MIPAFAKGYNHIFQMQTLQQLEDLRDKCKDKMIAILFWASWYPECEEYRKLFEDLCIDHSHIRFCWTDADKDKEIVKFFKVKSVPIVVLLHPHKTDGELIDNPKRINVIEVMTAYEDFYNKLFINERVRAYNEIEDILNSYPIVIFIRGSPNDPQCKSSKVLLEYLTKMEIKYRHFDILTDQRMKEWLKFYANWPTFPQIYLNQKFVGGTDIVIEMIENDEFLGMIPSECIKTNALERIKIALSKSLVVVFLKGTPKKPKDGYQAECIKLLDENQIRYTYFDVLKDPDLREILKEYSRWSAYPQIFIQEKFFGGLDILKEAVEQDKLTHYIPTTEIEVPMEMKIQRLIHKGKHMIFLRGTPEYPTCMDSKKMMDTLMMYPLLMKDLKYFDLCADESITQGLLKFSNFGSIPQLYVDGKLIGGREMVEGLEVMGQLRFLIGEKEAKHEKQLPLIKIENM